MVGERKLSDMEQGGDVRVPRKDISEPDVQLRPRRRPRHVLPGNHEYIAGDRIRGPKAAAEAAAAAATRAARATAEDEFVFPLSREEFMQIFFDDLELPRLTRTEFGPTTSFKSMRAGYARRACPPICAVVRTMTQALARRIALRRRACGARRSGCRRSSRSRHGGGHAELAAPLHAELDRLERRQRRGAVPRRSRPALPPPRAGGRSRSPRRRCSA